MKTLLKTLALIIVFAIFEGRVTAQVPEYSNETLQKVENMSIMTMDSDINSLVESVIFNMMVFKMKKPEWNFEKILIKLNDLSKNGKSVTVKYKAQLASMFITHFNMFENTIALDKDNPSAFFKEVAAKFQHENVASN